MGNDAVLRIQKSNQYIYWFHIIASYHHHHHHHPNLPSNWPHPRALYQFVGGAEDELSLTAGEVVRVQMFERV